MPTLADGASALRTAFTDPKSTHARFLLKVLSLGAGAFLVFAGIWGGCTTPIMGGGSVYFIGAMYAVVFGLVMLTVELKDKGKLVARAYDLVDTYLKFLTLQRGKGAFYLGVGLLVAFMTPTTSMLGVNNIAAIILAVVGFLHTSRIIEETAIPSDPSIQTAVPPASDGLDFSQPIKGGL